jgi:GTPase SAR1 family protein
LINEDALKVLEGMKDELAVVTVVGPFHSGKSFLLNQLMEKTHGFQIGPTVEPSTRVSDHNYSSSLRSFFL